MFSRKHFALCVLVLMLAGITLADGPKPSTVETQEIEPGWKETDHGSILSMAVSPDGKQVATAGTLPGDVSSIGDAFVRAVTGRNPTGGMQLRQLDSGQVTLQVNNLLRTVNQVVYSRDGTTMAVACAGWKTPGQVVLLETATGKILTRFKAHSGCACSVAFSPDGQRIVSGGSKMPDSQVRSGEAWLWDVSSGEGRKIWESDQDSVGSVAFSPDGKYLAVPVGSWNRGGAWAQVNLWNVQSQELESETLFAAEDLKPATTAKFRVDGRTLIVGFGNGDLRRWSVIRK